MDETQNENGAAIRELIERVCADDRFRPHETVCLRIYYSEPMTIRALSDRIRESLGATHRRLVRAQRKMGAVVVEMFTDPEDLRQARRLLACLRETHGRKGGNGSAASQLPELVPVRTAARLCGVDAATMRAWMADPNKEIRGQQVERNGRNTECVPLSALPLSDEYRHDYRALKARIVTEDDLVTWRECARHTL
jgi:hypothetical protein